MEADQTFAQYFARAQEEALYPRELQILDLRYGIPSGQTHTLEEIGRQFCRTRERIRQLSAKGLRKIRVRASIDLARGRAQGACASLVLYLEDVCRPGEPGYRDRVIAFAQTALPQLPPRSHALPLLASLLCPPFQSEQCIGHLRARYAQRSPRSPALPSDTPDLPCPNPAYHRHPVAGQHGQYQDLPGVGDHRTVSSALQSLALLRSGLSVQQIARMRALGEGTVLAQLGSLIEAGEEIAWEPLIPQEQYSRIVAAFERVGEPRLRAVKDLLGDDVSYGAIRFVWAVLHRERRASAT